MSVTAYRECPIGNAGKVCVASNLQENRDKVVIFGTTSKGGISMTECDRRDKTGGFDGEH